MPILVTIVLIAGYPLKAYFLASVSWDVPGLGALSFLLPWVNSLSPQTLFETYYIGMVGLGVYFLIAFLLLDPRTPRWCLRDWTCGLNRRRLLAFLWLLLIVSLALTSALDVIALRLGILRLGAEPVHLPFRLTGIINYSRGFIGGTLPILILYYALMLNARRLIRGSGVVILMNAASFAIVTSSRGALILLLILPVLLLITMGRLSLKQLLRLRWIIAGGFLLVVFLVSHFFVSNYRMVLTEGGLNPIVTLRMTAELVGAVIKEDPTASLRIPLGQIAARFIGIEQLIILKEIQGRPDSEGAWRAVFGQGQQMAAYYTRDVLGINTYDYQITPGLMGTFWQFGGLPAVVFGMAAFTAVLFLMNALYGLHVPLVSAPVLLASVAIRAAGLASDGTLQQAFGLEPLFFSLVAFIMTEVTARFIIRWTST